MWRDRADLGDMLLLLVAGVALGGLVAHCCGVVAVSLEVVAEPGIFMGDGILENVEHIDNTLFSGGSYLVNLRQHEYSHEGCQKAQGARNPEGVLALADRIGCVLLDDWDHVCADESSDLAEGGGV